MKKLSFDHLPISVQRDFEEQSKEEGWKSIAELKQATYILTYCDDDICKRVAYSFYDTLGIPEELINDITICGSCGRIQKNAPEFISESSLEKLRTDYDKVEERKRTQ